MDSILSHMGQNTVHAISSDRQATISSRNSRSTRIQDKLVTQIHGLIHSAVEETRPDQPLLVHQRSGRVRGVCRRAVGTGGSAFVTSQPLPDKTKTLSHFQKTASEPIGGRSLA